LAHWMALPEQESGRAEQKARQRCGASNKLKSFDFHRKNLHDPSLVRRNFGRQ
jgi:hypothetical protein